MPEMFTIPETARILGGSKPLAQRTLAAWRKAGTGPPFIRIGRSVRYPLDGLQRFLNAHKSA